MEPGDTPDGIHFWFSGSRVHSIEHSMDGAVVNIRKEAGSCTLIYWKICIARGAQYPYIRILIFFWKPLPEHNMIRL